MNVVKDLNEAAAWEIAGGASPLRVIERRVAEERERVLALLQGNCKTVDALIARIRTQP